MNHSSKSKVKVYANVRQHLELARKIFHKHLAEGEHSLLSSMDGFSWNTTGPKIDFCLQKHKEAVKLSRQAEEIYRQRDAVLAEIADTIVASKSIILQLHPADTTKLNEWGFLTTDHLVMVENIPP